MACVKKRILRSSERQPARPARRIRRIGITLGDPAGIGPEVIAAALRRMPRPGLSSTEFVIIGNDSVLARFWPETHEWPDLVHLSARGAGHIPGRQTADSGRDSLLYLQRAVAMLKAGALDGLVTGPVSKESISRLVPGFKGHTTWLAGEFGLENVEMLFLAGAMRMVLVTRHVAIKEVPVLVTRRKIVSVTAATVAFLKERLGIKAPKVAVCGLNPHAGEGGKIGCEDQARIVPAIRDLVARGWNVRGPFAADTLFEPNNCASYDLIVSMYHDQGLSALKSRYFDELVNVTVGLPFIRTSPAHGTAFGIAGKGSASCGSMLAAIKAAVGLAR